MTKNNNNNNQGEQGMKAIVNFTIHCSEQLTMANRGLVSNTDAIESVQGYKRAIDDLLGGDVLGYVYQWFLNYYLSNPETRGDAKKYFEDTAKMYKDLM